MITVGTLADKLSLPLPDYRRADEERCHGDGQRADRLDTAQIIVEELGLEVELKKHEAESPSRQPVSARSATRVKPARPLWLLWVMSTTVKPACWTLSVALTSLRVRPAHYAAHLGLSD